MAEVEAARAIITVNSDDNAQLFIGQAGYAVVGDVRGRPPAPKRMVDESC